MVYLLLASILILVFTLFAGVKSPEMELMEYNIKISKENIEIAQGNAKMLESLEESNKEILNLLKTKIKIK